MAGLWGVGNPWWTFWETLEHPPQMITEKRAELPVHRHHSHGFLDPKVGSLSLLGVSSDNEPTQSACWGSRVEQTSQSYTANGVDRGVLLIFTFWRKGLGRSVFGGTELAYCHHGPREWTWPCSSGATQDLPQRLGFCA